MKHSQRHHAISLGSLTLLLGIISFGQDAEAMEMFAMARNHDALQRNSRITSGPQVSMPASFEGRVANRLERRLRRRELGGVPPLSVLTEAIQQRQKLLTHAVSVTFGTDTNPEHAIWETSLQKYPLWLVPKITVSEAAFVVDEDRILETVERENVTNAPAPVDAVIRDIAWRESDESVSRAEIEGVAKPGYVYDPDTAPRSIADAYSTGTNEVRIELTRVDGRLVNETDFDLGDLKVLAVGRSNFAGSPVNRASNVRKALDEHVNNAFVAPGDSFSFNSTLAGPVSQGRGWRMALVILEGGRLEYQPGGGICQASTTVYRAALNAGFPVEERKAHSLYVTYYEKYGVGIDATIYPGTQDLVFTNDSANPIIIQAFSEGDDAYVAIYGSPDGRKVDIAGPFFSENSAGLTVDGRPVGRNEIAWLRRVTYPEGTVRENTISSRYKALPRSVVSSYVKTLHASAQ